MREGLTSGSVIWGSEANCAQIWATCALAEPKKVAFLFRGGHQQGQYLKGYDCDSWLCTARATETSGANEDGRTDPLDRPHRLAQCAQIRLRVPRSL